MIIENSRFGYDKNKKRFFIKSENLDKELINVLLNEDRPEIIFEFDSSVTAQMLKYYSLVRDNAITPVYDEDF